jgi:hypothetical protein
MSGNMPFYLFYSEEQFGVERLRNFFWRNISIIGNADFRLIASSKMRITVLEEMAVNLSI